MVTSQKRKERLKHLFEGMSKEEEEEEGEEELSEDEYEVEKVLDSRIEGGVRQYLLKWKGYPMSENTWEDESNMSCDDLVKEYWSRVNKAKAAKSKSKHDKQPIPQIENYVEENPIVAEPEKKKDEKKDEDGDDENKKVPKVSKGIWWLKDYDEESNDEEEDDDGVIVYEPEPKKPVQKHDEVSEEENPDVVPPLFDCVVSHRETSNGFDLLVRWFVFHHKKVLFLLFES